MGIFNQKPDVAAMWKAKDRDGLMKALEYADDTIRLNAAYALAGLDYEEAEKPFIDVLEHCEDWQKITIPRGQVDLSGMEKYATDPIRHGLIPQLWDTKAPVKHRAMLLLGFVGKDAVEPLIEIGLRHEDWRVRALATVALGKNGSLATDPLLKALSDPNSNVRWGAVQALRMIGDKNAIQALSALLEDDDERIRASAKEAINA